LIRNFRNSITTPLVFDKNHPKTWSRADFGGVVPVPGLSHGDRPLGQAQPVPVGQADWDKLCLSQWDKHRLSQLGLGKVKRDLSLSHGTSHIPTLEAFPCPGTSSLPTMELVPVPLVPTCPTKCVLLCFIDPRVRKIRNEASSCPGIFSRTVRFYYVASSPVHPSQWSRRRNIARGKTE